MQNSQYQPEQDQTFVSQNGVNFQGEQLWKPFDFLFPAGKLAKLVRVYDTVVKDLPWGDILYKLKLTEGFPVINLIGGKDTGRGKFLAGIARAAFNCDAIIIDSGISTGIEKYALRRGLKLIGVAPESEIKFPKINPTFIDPYELSNGHTHLFLLNKHKSEFTWTEEVWFKTSLAVKLAEGRGPKGAPRTDGRARCKIVHILLGDTPYYIDELTIAIRQKLPIIVVKGSEVCNQILYQFGPEQDWSQEYDMGDNNNNQAGDGDDDQSNDKNGKNKEKPKPKPKPPQPVSPELEKLMQNPDAHFFYLNSEDSEDIAQYLHFLLTVTPYDDGTLKQKPEIDQNGDIIEPEPQEDQGQQGVNQNQSNVSNQPPY